MDLEVQLTIARLRDAAELYRQLARVRRDEQEGARRGRDLDALDAEYAADAAVARGEGEAGHVEAAGLERDLRALEARLQQRRSVRAPDAATQLALADEIAALRRQRDELEQRLLEVWQRDQDSDTIAAADAAEAAAERERIAERRQTQTARAERAGLARPEIENDLHHLLRRLPPRVASRLARLAGRHDDPIADLVQGACDSCGQALPAQLALDVDREAQLVTCQGCGRYVVPRSSRKTRDQGWTT